MYVHQNNVIHRDIKPENIMRRQSDRKLILIDFGTVKELSSLVVNPSGKTSTTVRIGTPGYMPSEQALGKPKLSSDIYAVGMTAIFALTGIEPQQLPESNGEIIWQNKASVSNKLGEVLTKMVRYDYRQRFVNANDALGGLVSGVTTGATVPISVVPNFSTNKLQIAKKYLKTWVVLPIVILPIWAVFKSIKLPIQQTATTPKASPTPSIRTSSKPKPTRTPSKISQPIASPKPIPTAIISQPIPSPTPTPSPITIISQPIPSPKPIPTPTAKLIPSPTPIQTPVAVYSPPPLLLPTPKPKLKLNIANKVGFYSGKTVNKSSQKQAKISLEIIDVNDSDDYEYLKGRLVFSEGFSGAEDVSGSINPNGTLELSNRLFFINDESWNIKNDGNYTNNNTITGTYKLIPIYSNPNRTQVGEFTVTKEN